MLKHYLLEQAVQHYIRNVEQVLEQLSISSLLFGSVKLDEVQFVPETVQDVLFSYVFVACEITQVVAKDVEASMDWLSIMTTSVQLRIATLEIDMVLHDANDLEAACSFWDAQAVRTGVESEALGVPAESTLFYKVTSGLDVVVGNLSIHIRYPQESSPRLHCSLTGLRYCPATKEGAPTQDLDTAIRPQPHLQQVHYGYHFEVKSILFSLAPKDGEMWQQGGAPSLALEGLKLASHGHCPAHRMFQAPFYVEGVLAVELSEVHVPRGRISLEGLSGIIEVLSQAVVSDSLRERFECERLARLLHCQQQQAALGGIDIAPGCEVSDGLCQVGSPESSPGVEVRYQNRERDLANLLAGCRSSSRAVASGESLRWGSKPSPQKPVAEATPEHGALSRPGGAPAPLCTAEDATSACDSEDFKECEEEFRPVELPSSTAWRSSREGSHWRSQGGLKRISFAIGAGNVCTTGSGGDVGVEFAEFHVSSDKRWRLSALHMTCLQRLFEDPTPQAAGQAGPAGGTVVHVDSTEAALGAQPGVIYAGASLASGHVFFRPESSGVASELIRLRNGARLRHRGAGDPVLHREAGAQQLLELEVTGLSLKDSGREEVIAAARQLAASVASAPSVEEGDASKDTSPVEVPICYSLEAVDVSLEALVAEQPWRGSLPCLRLRSVFRDLEDIWSYRQWGTAVTRGVSDPLRPFSAMHSAVDGWRPLDSSCGDTASDLITRLEQRADAEHQALEAERIRTKQLEAKLEEVLRLVQQWPSGPMPLALRRLVASTGEASTPRGCMTTAVSSLPGVASAVYELDVGQDVRHLVEGLRRGDKVQWTVEEMQELTVDITAIVRSSCKLHAARRLRDTVRTSSTLESFEVTEDFGEEQLPLTLEIQVSNAFSWWAKKSVRLRFCKAEDRDCLRKAAFLSDHAPPEE